MRTSARRCSALGWSVLLSSLVGSTVLGQRPYGLETRAPIGPYLNNIMPPRAGAFPFPSVLSATGAFANLRTLTPSAGLIPFAVNSPLWSDGAIKSRWIALPNDGAPYGPNEQISFAPIGEWRFPNGTVFVKHFELIVNEITGRRKRLETRLLVRNSEGAVYGVSYKWRADNSDADLLPDGLDENISVTTASGSIRVQKYSYPSRAQCLFCHNAQANYILGVKTHQLNGDFAYPTTRRTDNQLRTFAHIGMLNPSPDEAAIPTYLRSVMVSDPTSPIQLRMRSWIDSNCSQCHRPGGFCPSYDARFYTPLTNQNLINRFVRFRDLAGSELYQRDNSLGAIKMPPLIKNRIHETAMAVMRQWIASPLEVLSVNLYQDASHLAVRFNSRVDPATGAIAPNYSLDQDKTITEAAIGPNPDTVILTTSSLLANQTYTLTTHDVRDTAPSANTIWPYRGTSFIAQFEPMPSAHWLANISTRVSVGRGDAVAIAGFIVRGGPNKRVMIRAIGPSLAVHGISNALADPVLELYNSAGDLIATNDNWRENANEQEIIDTGIKPISEKESVILMRLPTDETGVAYTAVLRGANATTGVGLVELYDLDRGLGPNILNISSRGRVDLGNKVLIGGFILKGSNQVIVRAIGPSLGQAHISDALSDPTLDLRDGNGTRLAFNDNWGENAAQAALVRATGIPPNSSFESAIVANLPAGAYTAIVAGKGGGTGTGLVEIYSLNE